MSVNEPPPGPAGAGFTILSCRDLWKIYGPDADQMLDGAELPRSAEDRRRLIEAVRAHDHIPAACDVAFDVAEGEVFVIMGLSGSGKSTVIRCLSRRLGDPGR